MDQLEQLRYPVGRFRRTTAPVAAETRHQLIDEIAETPSAVRTLVQALDDAALDTPYRPGGWTVRQVVHHLPDSHMNAYVRMKLAATADAPAVVTYDEVRWAELPDARSAPIGPSLDLLTALHTRWVHFLRALDERELQRTYVHPELGPVPLYDALGLYAWHCRHHTAHIRNGISRRTD